MTSPAKRYFPLSLDVENRRVLVVGGDVEAFDKSRRLVDAGARVVVVAPDVCPELADLAARTTITWYARTFTPQDAAGCRLVVLSERNPERAAELRALGARYGYLFCAIDQPAFCDWIHPAVVAAGPVTVAFASGGVAPALLKRLREGLARALDARFVGFAEKIASLRGELLERPAAERKQALDEALEGFVLDVRVHYPAWEVEGHDPGRGSTGFRSGRHIAGNGGER